MKIYSLVEIDYPYQDEDVISNFTTKKDAEKAQKAWEELVDGPPRTEIREVLVYESFSNFKEEWLGAGKRDF
jgi:hypothetical protein